ARSVNRSNTPTSISPGEGWESTRRTCKDCSHALPTPTEPRAADRDCRGVGSRPYHFRPVGDGTGVAGSSCWLDRLCALAIKRRVSEQPLSDLQRSPPSLGPASDLARPDYLVDCQFGPRTPLAL